MSAAADRTRRAALALAAFLALLHAAAALRGAFRADDWVNLERAADALSPDGWRAVWTQLNPFTLYRPLVDLWHAGLLRAFGLSAPPMLLALVGLLALQSWLLARLVRARGGSRDVAALAAAAVWAQPNALAWTTLWVSNATGALMTTCALLALLAHHRAVRRAGAPPGARPGTGWLLDAALAGLAVAAGVLCKEEAVLVPAIALALEAARWRRLDPRARRAAIASLAAMLVVAAAYAWFRTQVLPTPGGANRYHLTLGAHSLRNAAFLAMHLGALPLVALVLTGLTMPAVFRPEARADASWGVARAEMLAGLGWAAVAVLLYLPIAGRPAYGYLYAPAFGVAYTVASGLGWAAGAAARGGARVPRAASVLAAHAGLAAALTVAGLVGVGWPSYRALVAEARATLRRDLPDPPPGASFAFLDAGAAETFSGRSLFNLVFDDATGSFVRLLYARHDLDASVVHGAGGAAPAGATLVYRAERGRIVRIATR